MIAAVADVAPWIVAGAGGVAAWIAGRWQFRIATRSPASVAEGYGQLVRDVQNDNARLRAEVGEIRHELDACLVKHAAADRELGVLRVELEELRRLVQRPPDARTRVDD